MREILFRGKRVDNGEWVEGLLWKKKYDTPKLFMSYFPNKDDDEDVVVIDPETVGQYTGLKDTNGKKIFEGDIVESTSGMFDIDTIVRKVVFFKGAWGLSDFNEEHFRAFVSMSEYVKSHKIIGNIHDTNL